MQTPNKPPQAWTQYQTRSRNSPSSAALSLRNGQAVALIDLASWPGMTASGLASLHLVVYSLMRPLGVSSSLLRCICYGDPLNGPVEGFIPDLVLRTGLHLPSAMALSMSRDITSLASSGSIDTLLIATQDAPGLLAAIDHAQLSGVRVALITPLSAAPPSSLGWLQAADRWIAADLAARCQEETARTHQAANCPEMSPEEVQQRITQVIDAWWAELYPDEQEELGEELQEMTGLPPDIDRDLLRALKAETGRTLSFDEKKQLRAMTREAVFNRLKVG